MNRNLAQANSCANIDSKQRQEFGYSERLLLYATKAQERLSRMTLECLPQEAVWCSDKGPAACLPVLTPLPPAWWTRARRFTSARAFFLLCQELKRLQTRGKWGKQLLLETATFMVKL